MSLSLTKGASLIVLCLVVIVLLTVFLRLDQRISQIVFVHEQNLEQNDTPHVDKLVTNDSQVSLRRIGLDHVSAWVQVDVDAIPTKQLQLAYHRLMNTVHMRCLSRVRLGNYGDGGWDICSLEPYRPQRNNCLMYSFGINNDWSFDKAAEKTYACTIRAFDPTMAKHPKEEKISKLIYFYPWGLSGNDTIASLGRKDKQFQLYTLDTLRKKLGDDKKIIDYLKMDIEGSEWVSLENMIKDGVLKDIKQIGIEFHSAPRLTPTPDAYARFIHIVNNLESLGWRKWYTNWNMHCKHTVPEYSYQVTYCHEVYYINTNFLPEYNSNTQT